MQLPRREVGHRHCDRHGDGRKPAKQASPHHARPRGHAEVPGSLRTVAAGFLGPRHRAAPRCRAVLRRGALAPGAGAPRRHVAHRPPRTAPRGPRDAGPRAGRVARGSANTDHRRVRLHRPHTLRQRGAGLPAGLASAGADGVPGDRAELRDVHVDGRGLLSGSTTEDGGCEVLVPQVGMPQATRRGQKHLRQGGHRPACPDFLRHDAWLHPRRTDQGLFHAPWFDAPPRAPSQRHDLHDADANLHVVQHLRYRGMSAALANHAADGHRARRTALRFACPRLRQRWAATCGPSRGEQDAGGRHFLEQSYLLALDLRGDRS
mmetsp:Transcript_110568/g.285792  ORF Transcript_110568/g.285792 Transcript_110568/m.285792 type:complete len:320 (+) Transcript_110568:85-1044(+)